MCCRCRRGASGRFELAHAWPNTSIQMYCSGVPTRTTPIARSGARSAEVASEMAASLVSRRCTAVPIGAEGAARSALKATSEAGTGGPATRVIEADVLPTSPGHGDA